MHLHCRFFADSLFELRIWTMLFLMVIRLKTENICNIMLSCCSGWIVEYHHGISRVIYTYSKKTTNIHAMYVGKDCLCSNVVSLKIVTVLANRWLAIVLHKGNLLTFRNYGSIGSKTCTLLQNRRFSRHRSTARVSYQ